MKIIFHHHELLTGDKTEFLLAIAEIINFNFLQIK